jgi:hypothetical protein
MKYIKDKLPAKIASFFRRDWLFFVLLLSFIAIIIHLPWFKFSTILTGGDWSYWPNEEVKQVLYSWGAWMGNSDFGIVNVQIPFNLFMSAWWLLVHLGMTYNQAVKLTFLIPIAIFNFLSPYFLVKKLTKNNLAAFVAAIFYGTTTYGIVNQLPIQFIYAIAPLILLLFIRAIETNRVCDWLLFVLLYWVGTCYEVRIMYVITFILLFYFLFFHLKEIKKYWRNILISSFITLALCLFWILPIIFGGISTAVATLTNRGLFGDFLFDIQRSLTLSMWNWNGGLQNIQFIPQPILWQFWILPIVLVAGFFLKQTYSYRKQILFFWVLSLVGILLTKQSGVPLVSLYQWLYEHFPGFNLFREASKFYVVTALGYMGLLGYFVASLQKNLLHKKIIFYTLIFLLCGIFLWNSKPLITGEIVSFSVSKNIPNDYLVLKEIILSDPNFSRTFWVPRYSQWGIITNEHPRISDASVNDEKWGNYTSLMSGYDVLPENEQILDPLKITNANNLFDNSSIKYVIVPLQDKANDDDFFIDYGGRENPNIRQWYIDQLDKVTWLKKIDISTKDLVMYENANYRPHIYVTSEQETVYKNLPFTTTDWQLKDPTKYTVKLNNISKPVFLNFSEAYHQDWKLHLGNFNWFSVLLDKNYFIPDSNHFKNDAMLNSFYLDPAQICSGNKCEKNGDGSYNLELTLYFKPQSYFYLGLIISGTTLVGCFAYLSWDFVKRRKKDKKQ